MKHFSHTFISLYSAAAITLFGFAMLKGEQGLLSGDDLSEAIFTSAEAGFNTSNFNIFTDYLTWDHSQTLNSNDTMAQVFMRLYETNHATTVTDFNGDGLADVWLHDGSKFEYALFLNTGSGFALQYKCKYVPNVTPRMYYGDCSE